MVLLLFGDPYFWSNARPIAFKLIVLILLFAVYKYGFYRGKKAGKK